MSRLKNAKILIVDDHHNMRKVWRNLLVGFGAQRIYDVEDAMSAIQLLKEEETDLLILDQNMPDISGAEMMRMIRSSNELPSLIPAIACTADTRRSTLRELVNAGVDEILAKPVSANHAWSKISSVVNNRRAFVRTSIYFGPDRRRKETKYNGPERRSGVTPDEDYSKPILQSS